LTPFTVTRIQNHILPLYVQIEVTTKCNFRCVTCKRTDETSSDISAELFKSIIDQYRPPRGFPARLDLTGLGEPLFHTGLVSMIRYAKEHGFQVSFTSNFSLINERNALSLIESQLDFLYVSFDGATRETFEKIRIGGSFERTMSNVKLFLRARRHLGSVKPKLIFETTISVHNVHEVPEIVRLADKLGADAICLYRQVTPEKARARTDKDLFASIDWKELSKSGIEIIVAGPEQQSYLCAGAIGCYITFDGKVLQCSRMIQLLPRESYPGHQFGDLNRSSLSEIWFSSRYKSFRNGLLQGAYPPACKSCPRALSRLTESRHHLL
jgi:radical SAM protein with 4Fe4S-binding SPASM domain